MWIPFRSIPICPVIGSIAVTSTDPFRCKIICVLRQVSIDAVNAILWPGIWNWKRGTLERLEVTCQWSDKEDFRLECFRETALNYRREKENLIAASLPRNIIQKSEIRTTCRPRGHRKGSQRRAHHFSVIIVCLFLLHLFTCHRRFLHLRRLKQILFGK
jgi:hypothetical protein